MPNLVDSGVREPVRRVFFSFHYQRDIFRVHVIKNHWVPTGSRMAARYFDGSLEEESKRQNDYAIKQMIGRALNGCSVTCVLIGAETYTRRWVDYEIFKSIQERKGLFGIRVHQVKDARTQQPDSWGTNPFWTLGFGTHQNSDLLWPKVRLTSGWADHSLFTDGVPRDAAPYLPAQGTVLFSDLFSVYDWVNDDGPRNFPNWVGAAAHQAGR